MIKRKTKFLTNNNGSVMLFSILLMTLFFVIISSLAVLTIGEIRQATQVEESSSAYMAAETGFERAQNYVKNDTPISKPDQPLRSGIKPPTYTFEVKKAGAGVTYDTPGRKCDSTITNTADPDYKGGENLYYCFYSRGTSGTTVRKLDGVTKIRSIDQGLALDFSTYSTSPPWTLFPSSSQKISLMDITPTVKMNDSFTLSGLIKVDGMAPGSLHYFGLLNNGGNGDRKGIGIKVYNESGTHKIALVGQTINTSSATITSDNSDIAVDSMTLADSPSPAWVSFTLTYRRAAVDKNSHTVTLQVNNIANSKCLGVKTFTFADKIFDYYPFSAYFLSGETGYTVQPTKSTVTNPYDSSGISTIQTLSMSMSGGASPINLANFVFNTNGTTATSAYVLTLTNHLTINKLGGCSGCTVTANPVSGSDDYDEGTSVSLTPTASAGYSFDNWSGCDSVTTDSPPKCNVRMSSAKTVNVTFVSNVLASGVWLTPDNYRVSENGQYKLIYLRSNGKLTLYRTGNPTPIWANTFGSTTPGYASMQGDGNFVLATTSWAVYMNSATCCHSGDGYYLKVTDDGHVRIYKPADGSVIFTFY